MKDSPVISVVIPIHNLNHKLPRIRKVLFSASVPIQVIIVLNNKELIGYITPRAMSESVVYSPRQGRGFAFLEGAKSVKGTITLLLHSDTIPPIGWDQAILSVMKDPEVVGGGFSLAYRIRKPLLELGNWILKQWFRISGEFYGDRAMFIRSDILKECLPKLEVPLFEDLLLSKCLHKHGRVVLLREKVETKAASLQNLGLIRYIGNFWLCRIWYALGGTPSRIYRAYYSIKGQTTPAEQ